MHFIALSMINGPSLSKLRGGGGGSSGSGGFPPGVWASAKDGLERLRKVVPGFLHGDIRLENMMWGVRYASSGESAASCVFIDFGRSKSGVDNTQQAQEDVLLGRLFQLLS